jgi:nuclear polyadenylated RNA-binding protein NAB2
MAISMALGTPLAEDLSAAIRPKLAEMGWTVGGGEDSSLAEYILLLVINGKTEGQIAAELSNDLLNLGPDDSGATDFASWLFQQVESLSNRASGNTVQDESSSAQAPSMLPEEIPGRRSDDPGGQDAEMTGVTDGAPNDNM